ncbi:MAG: MoaD/ThiS family protein [Parvibaculaceae bacterium]|nr:MoaD/ThiS family protein [Parvibaculaceae bacterium]|tara:strand:- start:302 stop:556 length:255 start_codon:yes stop_codon:yes gene_type:complete
MKVLYFAWFRDRIGMAEEEIDLTGADKLTVRDFIHDLAGRGDGYATAFEDMNVVHVALDMQEVDHDTIIGGASEIAFYPPFTGG